MFPTGWSLNLISTYRPFGVLSGPITSEALGEGDTTFFFQAPWRNQVILLFKNTPTAFLKSRSYRMIKWIKWGVLCKILFTGVYFSKDHVSYLGGRGSYRIFSEFDKKYESSLEKYAQIYDIWIPCLPRGLKTLSLEKGNMQCCGS